MAETHRVAVDGLDFHCRLDGAAGAPWMVFSNSLLTDLSLWDMQVAAFAGRYRILRYDQRGHGGTAVPAEPATLPRLAEDATALLEHFGVRDAVFVGVSMGAATALAVAARRPKLVATVVAADGQAATAPGGAEAWRQRMAQLRREGMAAYAEATLPRWFAAASRARGDASLRQARRMMLGTPEEGVLACAAALQDYDLSALLPALRQPVLLIAGAEDGAMPQTMRRLAQALPCAEFLEIPEAGHLPCLERPAAFNGTMAEFLQRLEASG